MFYTQRLIFRIELINGIGNELHELHTDYLLLSLQIQANLEKFAIKLEKIKQKVDLLSQDISIPLSSHTAPSTFSSNDSLSVHTAPPNEPSGKTLFFQHSQEHHSQLTEQ